jgi:hypothetical protein
MFLVVGGIDKKYLKNKKISAIVINETNTLTKDTIS